jgi:hypothetical protein
VTDNTFPPGWDEERAGRLLAQYETQSEDEAAADDEAAAVAARRTLMVVPNELVPIVRDLIRKQGK